MPTSPDGEIPAPVKGLAAVSLMNDFASEMVYPLLPAFVTGTLGGGAVALGALDGAADLTASTLRWFSGRWADRRGARGPLILAGYLTAIVLRPVIGFTTAAWQVIGVRVLDRVGKGLRSPARDALIADVTPAPLHGRAFGLHRTADHLGAVLGSLMAAELLRRGMPIRRVLSLSLVPGLVAVVALMVALAAARGRVEPAAAPVRSGDVDDGRPSAALAWLAVLAALRLPETLLLLRLQDLRLAVAAVPLIWALLHVVKSAASYPSGMVADRLGPAPALAVGTVAYAVTMAGLARVTGAGPAIAIFLAHGLASGLVEPAERTAVARVAGSKRGRAFGNYQAMAGLGSLVTGIGYGWLYQTRGGPACLAGAAALTALVVVGWLVMAAPALGRRPV